jgi:CRP-like cAMP-binding protein
MLSAVQQTKLPCPDCPEKSCAAASLHRSELVTLSENSRETTFKAGDVILHEGSMISHIIYLKSGLVKEFQKSPRQHEQILQIIKQYSYLGLSSLFGDKINNYSYAALTDIKVCYINMHTFQDLIRHNGSFAYEILVSTSRDSLNNFHRVMAQAQKKAYGRVADALQYFSNYIFESDNFVLPFTRQEFADLIGISRESTTRVLTRFHEEGILEIDLKHIRILQPEKLSQIGKNG